MELVTQFPMFIPTTMLPHICVIYETSSYVCNRTL